MLFGHPPFLVTISEAIQHGSKLPRFSLAVKNGDSEPISMI